MTQTWHHLLFAHWPIPAEAMRVLVPQALDLDLYAGQAWLGVVPFGMRNVRPRLLPAVPWLSHFPELNVRTYVRLRDRGIVKPGVFFFSLDAANPVAVEIARRTFFLPYFRARMRLTDDGRRIHYQSARTHANAPGAVFIGSYGPVGPVYHAIPSTHDHWLTERYALYTTGPGDRPYIGEIHHLPWPLQLGEADLQVNTMAGAAAMHLPDVPPLLHFAREIVMVAWPLRPVEDA
jgi:uncharacterized protein YqjF (DUF2071 family)